VGTQQRIRLSDPAPTPIHIADETIRLAPQPGPQTAFAECTADIAIYGGAAGSGKSWSLLLDPLRDVPTNKKYAAVIFRRTTPSITNPGGLWDESFSIYGIMGDTKPYESDHSWEFKAGGRVKFAHLEYDKTVLDWKGAQIPFIGFDELTEFSQYQFFYLLSRNRSTCGVQPYVRATTNPDAESWVAEFLSWWIDQGTGFPIPERAGVLRYFVRVGDEIRWADHPEELTHERLGIPRFDPSGREIPIMPKSVTFIPADIYDNPELLKSDPLYLANLLAQPTVDRERLLKGNWKIKPAAGLHFRREWVKPIKAKDLPQGLVWKRGYDLAATEKTSLNDPDYTTCTLIGKDPTGKEPLTYVADHQWAQESSGKVDERIVHIAKADGIETEIWLPQDPGAAGKSQAVYFKRVLDGYTVHTTPESRGVGSTPAKVTRFGPFSSAAQAGFVRYVEGPWNERWLSQLEGFPELPHDDDVDSTSRAFNAFQQSTTGILDYYRILAQEKLAAEGADRQALAGAGAYDDSEKVAFKGPAGTNVLYGLRGEAIFQNEKGMFMVTPKHAQYLRRGNSGFTEVK
jgi:predicted phage terminase large subunit-like protein